MQLSTHDPLTHCQLWKEWFGNQRHDCGFDRERAPIRRTAHHKLCPSSVVQEGNCYAQVRQGQQEDVLRRSPEDQFCVSIVACVQHRRQHSVLSAHGLLCVGGRLEHSMLPEKEKHPIILPKKHHVTPLLINHYHMLSGHSGKEFVLSLLRQKYWLIGATNYSPNKTSMHHLPEVFRTTM